MQSPQQAAEAATFQSFANCYLREVDSGREVTHKTRDETVASIEWTLVRQHQMLRAELVSPSLCGPHRFGRLWSRNAGELMWRLLEPISALQMLVHEAYRHLDGKRADDLRGQELELLIRLLESYQQTSLYLEKADPAPVDGGHFIEAEQSLAFGHWLHPTPKSRQGIAFWQQDTYAPELGGRFQLHYFAVRRSHVRHASAHDLDTPELIGSLFAEDAPPVMDDECLLPMHPLQAEALLLDPDIIRLRDDGILRSIGPAGHTFTATSSVRTVYSADCDWMLKFSLPVRITNSLRVNRRAELEAGVAMAKLMARIGFGGGISNFRIIHDPAYITVDLPGRAESGFEIIFRENPFRGENSVVTTAALTADPLPGARSRLAQLIEDLALREGEPARVTALRWFQRYLACAVEPLIHLYDRYGVALEAHQQNSLIDVGDGYPRGGYYRDNQGFYLSERYRPLLSTHVPEADAIGSLYFPEAEIRDRFAYYLVVNQVFSVISRMGHDGLCDERLLLRELRGTLERQAAGMSGAGRDFIRHVLDLPTIASKANLTTRLLDIDELQSHGSHRLYSAVPNPLRLAIAQTAEGAGHAIAS